MLHLNHFIIAILKKQYQKYMNKSDNNALISMYHPKVERKELSEIIQNRTARNCAIKAERVRCGLKFQFFRVACYGCE